MKRGDTVEVKYFKLQGVFWEIWEGGGIVTVDHGDYFGYYPKHWLRVIKKGG